MLVVKDITQTFGGLRALGGVSFTVAKGSIHSIIGPNGAGKTTLFNVLTGVYRPDAGSIQIEGREIRGKPPETIARLGMARTFQNIRLFGAMTVFENVKVGMHTRLRYSYLDALLRTPRMRRAEEAATDKIMELLERVGLAKNARTRSPATCPTASSAASRSPAPSPWQAPPPAAGRTRSRHEPAANRTR
jgi:ABC-type branched-subunit amino acid transport system ATPase component